MKKFLGGKKWTAVGIAFVLLVLVGLIVLAVRYYLRVDMTYSQTTFIEGVYSVDGGEWKPIDNMHPINERFHKVTLKGKLSENALKLFENTTIFSQNVWYTTKSADGKPVYELTYRNMDDLYNLYVQASDNPDDPMLDKEVFKDNYPLFMSDEIHLPDTPGYRTNIVYQTTLQFPDADEHTEYIVEVENPYFFVKQSFSDCFQVMYSEANGAYLQFFFDVMPAVVAFMLVCFFGIFLFPIAGFILGKINYKYFSFGALCFFWGLFMIGHKMDNFMNLWITDPTVCMAIEQLLNYCLVITVFVYLKSNLTGIVTRAVANLATFTYILIMIAAIILHFTAVRDLYASSPNLYIFTAAGTVIITVLLFTEVRHNSQAVILLASWTPLTLSIIIAAANYYFHFTDIHFYHFGLAVTMLYQIVRLVFDLRKQYLESIRYQQLQKELYEAKVSVMVSQIQPHFMYNALTSIAMMCSIDPETAQEATVTFAKYLRGNMDSLKQTKPIPFAQELEHLKKYLYIEKLRFGNKLNIEYDIQTSDFKLPQLSIQPLVENAVKHGVGMKKKGGTVTISTRETTDAYEVVIADDGVGFDTTAEQKDDGRSHIGMENTKRRLREMCGGEVIIESKIGEGTVATVILPKEGQNHEDTMS
ncbi:MAG: histidine kinase [Ruminococcus sp.]|nr:histidine kinase [Ruminococcus sp.]